MKLATANVQLRTEIRSVQSQLASAIQNHQMIVFKLKDCPVSIKLRVQMCNVQRHIISLGEKQKKLLAQLRKELEANTCGIKTEQKPNQPLHMLRPNPMNTLVSSKTVVKKEPTIKQECTDPSDSPLLTPKVELVTHTSRRKSKLVATPDLSLDNSLTPTPSTSPSQKENTPSSTPSSSPTHSGNKNPKQSVNRTPKHENVPPSSTSDESQDAFIHLPVDPEERKKLQFMTALSLVTREVLTELQNRRTERKRRSTANPLYQYGNGQEKRRKLVPFSSSPTRIPAVVVPSTDSSANTKPSICYACSSAIGTVVECCSCNKVFHWNCVFDATTPTPSKENLKCRACLSTLLTNGHH